MSAEAMERLRSEAMGLPLQARAALAHDLLDSLEAPADAGVAAAWDEEIVRRITQIENGEAKLVDRETLNKDFQAVLDNPSAFLKST